MKRALLAWPPVTALLAGCGGAAPVAPAAPPPAPAQAVSTKVVEANTRFGFNLFHELSRAQPNENLFISPTSVSLALTMTYNGARGETQQAMAKTLAIDGLPTDLVNQENGALYTILANPDPKVQLEIANSIWYKQGFRVNPAFADVVSRQYRAEIHPAKFGDPSAAKAINDWVSEATHGKIPVGVQETGPDDRMYLVNAIYFNGKWKEPFSPDLTRPRPFTLADGSSKEVQMMHGEGYYRYLQGDTFRAVALPYGDGRLNMYVFLPDSDVSLEQFSENLTPDRWGEWMTRFSVKKGALALPKVKITWDSELKQTLTTLGMGLAFQHGSADFGNLFEGTKEDLAIASVLHKTYLDVHEEGTEAAAVTIVTATTTSVGPVEESFEMVVDRPYLIAIRDDQTGALLFLGAIMNPEQEE